MRRRSIHILLLLAYAVASPRQNVAYAKTMELQDQDVNPLKRSGVRCLLTSRSVQCHPGLTDTFLISDIRALWRSWLSARAPECQKLKTYRLDLDGQV